MFVSHPPLPLDEPRPLKDKTLFLLLKNFKTQTTKAHQFIHKHATSDSNNSNYNSSDSKKNSMTTMNQLSTMHLLQRDMDLNKNKPNNSRTRKVLSRLRRTQSFQRPETTTSIQAETKKISQMASATSSKMMEKSQQLTGTIRQKVMTPLFHKSSSTIVPKVSNMKKMTKGLIQSSLHHVRNIRHITKKAGTSDDGESDDQEADEDEYEELLGYVRLLRTGDELLFLENAVPTELSKLCRGDLICVSTKYMRYTCQVSFDQDLPLEENIVPLSVPFIGHEVENAIIHRLVITEEQGRDSYASSLLSSNSDSSTISPSCKSEDRLSLSTVESTEDFAETSTLLSEIHVSNSDQTQPQRQRCQSLMSWSICIAPVVSRSRSLPTKPSKGMIGNQVTPLLYATQEEEEEQTLRDEVVGYV